MSARTWTIRLPWTAIPRGLSLNDRPTRWQFTRLKREARTATALLALAQRIPLLPGAVIELHYYPRDNRRRDRINLALLHKIAVDGCIDAGVCEDDDSSRVSTPEAVIHPADPRDPRMVLVVTEVQP